MFYSKYPHPANFTFADRFDPETQSVRVGARTFQCRVSAFEGDLTRLELRESGKRYPSHLTTFTPPEPTDPPAPTETFEFTIHGSLRLVPDAGFGVSGDQWLFQLEVPEQARYFGLGQKNFGRTELSGIRTKFWNTDVWSDFHFSHWEDHSVDPPYFSTPYLIIEIDGVYVGVLISTAYPAFFETPGRDRERVFLVWQQTSRHVILGAEGGVPDVWFLVGPSLRELTRKLQSLVGRTPLPPVWALGYHQSKWGYDGERELMQLDADFTQSRIPCDALWLDIDYMDGYRVFTVDGKHFPHGTQKVARKLARSRRRMVTILDPGVKCDPGYFAYDEGVSKGLFCQNPEGRPFVGLVWPGETVYPDFTLANVRNWWAKHVRKIAKDGFGGFWIDMNDPSTGPVDPGSMLFNRGRTAHAAHRNEYALGMQMATVQGLKMARPNERPFVLSRSGYTGSSRYAAIWTGDNFANYFHLKMHLPQCLGMSLSGLPFNGADIGGFGGHPDDQLMLDWYKAMFLFPFFRNHSGKGTPGREPYRLKDGIASVVRRYIRLRYKLMPYLYNLFIDQEELGDPILRPLMYEFDDDPELRPISDEFMVGPFILQAPVVSETERARLVELPTGKWMDANHGDWVSGVQHAHPGHAETPIYLRNGTILPMLEGMPVDNRRDFTQVEVHVFVDPTTSGTSELRYRADDGETFGYRAGQRSALAIRVEWDPKTLSIHTEELENGYGRIEPVFVVHGGPPRLLLNGQVPGLADATLSLTGAPIDGRKLAGGGE